jgi:hypothetical protein
MEAHPDREISTALLASFSRYPALRAQASAAQQASLAAALIALQRAMPAGVAGITGGVDFEKAQAGASPLALALLAETSVNPIVAQATGLLLVMFNVPSLPTLPPSATLLRHLWPRLQKYILLDPKDPLYAVCAQGAGGDEAAAAACFDEWREVRAPAAQAQLAAARQLLWQAFPNVDADGAPLSGSYLHETDFEDAEWRRSQWGDANYALLLDVKHKYDPAGLFICHHCVGSEEWTADGNCPL